ncbi:MAG: PHP domain-containing protein [Methanomassiliicoccales archaeon]|nr:PHP domain-containing protein [Methanomassiliicoccales archaeon]
MGKSTVINLHAHTTFSDGIFDIETIVREAARKGLTHIAITDHFETTKVCSLSKRDFKRYLATIENVKKKYEGTITVLAGVEIDANPDRCDLNGIPVEMLNSLDLVLFEHVNDFLNGGADIETVGEFISKLSVPCGLAHPDFEMAFFDVQPEDLAEMLSAYRFFIEINTAKPYRRNGMAFYERAEDLIAKLRGKVRFSIGTDVHRTLSEVYNVIPAYNFARKIGIEEDLLF